MLNSPLVSVIIPAYNAENYIISSLTSVLNQTYDNLEVIVVNDGSTDNTERLLKSCNNQKLRTFCIPNSGQCAAANFGFKVSKGKYIKFFDADDLMNEEHIASMVEYSIENDGYLILCKWARFYSTVDKAQFRMRPEWRNFETSIDWFKTALSDGPDMLPVWQWLIPRILIESCDGWDETLNLGNDFEFSSRLLVAAKGVIFCDAAWVYYRSGLETNMSTDVSPKTYMSVLNAIHKSREVILNDTSDKEIKDAFATKYFAWLITYYPYLNSNTVREIERLIKALGQVNYPYRWGWKFQLIKKVMGWKTARKLQYYYYSKRHNL